MSLVIPDEFVQAAQMSEAELLLELAIVLFQQDRVSLAKAARLVGMHRLDFQELLAGRQIPVHYDVEDFESDLETLRKLGRL